MIPGKQGKIGVKKKQEGMRGVDKEMGYISMNERGARTKMGRGGRIETQRLWNGNRYLREQSS